MFDGEMGSAWSTVGLIVAGSTAAAAAAVSAAPS